MADRQLAALAVRTLSLLTSLLPLFSVVTQFAVAALIERRYRKEIETLPFSLLACLFVVYSPRFQRGPIAMSLVKQIDGDLMTAMKSQDNLKLSVLRMMKSALKLKQVESGKPLEDAEALAVFRTLVKQRREAAALFRGAGRPELADKEEAEVKIVEVYLPAAASDAELEAAVTEALAETGAASAKETGKVMKAAMAKLAGKSVDGKRVNELVRARLGA